jgi:pimeloyl-ACP methyl ester carboxylesterase
VVVAAYAAAYPDRVERLVLASASPASRPSRRPMEAAMDEKAAEPVRRRT